MGKCDPNCTQRKAKTECIEAVIVLDTRSDQCGFNEHFCAVTEKKMQLFVCSIATELAMDKFSFHRFTLLEENLGFYGKHMNPFLCKAAVILNKLDTKKDFLFSIAERFPLEDSIRSVRWKRRFVLSVYCVCRCSHWQGEGSVHVWSNFRQSPTSEESSGRLPGGLYSNLVAHRHSGRPVCFLVLLECVCAFLLLVCPASVWCRVSQNSHPFSSGLFQSHCLFTFTTA